MSEPAIYLVSTSPRRRQILRLLGIKFRSLHPDFLEPKIKTSNAPKKFAITCALFKALSSLRRHNINSGLVIGMDTIVVQKNRILGKPANLSEALVNLGLLKDDREWSDLKRMTYGQWLREFVPEEGDLRQDVAKRLGLSIDSPVIQRLGWLGLFSDECIGLERGSSLDILAKAMLERMSYKPGERDMIVLQHQFEVVYPDNRGEFIESTLIDFGQPNGDSAMARTVSLPAAIAVKMIIEGQLQLTGVKIPVVPEIYQPVLTELEKLGIKFQERVRKIS